jgi:hypothetical protein
MNHRYGNPVALTPQVTVKMMDDGADIDGRTIPAPVSAAIVVEAALGQLVAPITPVQVTAVQDKPDEKASFKTAPVTCAPASSDTVTVYVVVLPASTVLVPLVLVMLKLAVPEIGSESCAWLLAGFESV